MFSGLGVRLIFFFTPWNCLNHSVMNSEPGWPGVKITSRSPSRPVTNVEAQRREDRPSPPSGPDERSPPESSSKETLETAQSPIPSLLSISAVGLPTTTMYLAHATTLFIHAALPHAPQRKGIDERNKITLPISTRARATCYASRAQRNHPRSDSPLGSQREKSLSCV